MPTEWFAGFETQYITTSGGASIHVRHGGSGPPLLLLHGYPQTQVMWHRVADRLAQHFTVVATDLRGYGDSKGPPPLPDGSNYSFRDMARDQVEVMRTLGYRHFLLAGHDRGARTAHRLALDHPAAVQRLALLDIQPTHHAWTTMSTVQLKRAWHWMLMAQPHDIPERLLSSVPKEWLLEKLCHLDPAHGQQLFSAAAYAEYLRCLTPEMIAASCADYRAFASIDVAHDEIDFSTGRRITCPTLVLYGENTYGRSDMRTIWSAYADDVSCRMIPGAGHYLAEEKPHAVLTALLEFAAKDLQQFR
ncbi:MAG: alpha/beta hydrolase [Spongiibacteraceae bacterium]